MLKGVLSAAKCAEYIDIAEKWTVEKNGGSWDTKRHQNYPTTDIPIANLSFHGELSELVKTHVFTELSAHYRFQVSEMKLLDFFIVKYDAKAQSKLGKLLALTSRIQNRML